MQEGVQMREMFWNLSKDVDVDMLACSEAVKLLRTMTEVWVRTVHLNLLK